MRLIKLAIGVANPTVGAVRSNADQVIRMAREMAAEDVTVGCFPEQVLGGYPSEDLVQWPAFVAAQRAELERIAAETRELPTVLVVGLVAGVGGHLFNVAAVLHAGRILGLVPKEKLPTYEVFYETRTMSRGAPGLELDADGVPLGDRIFAFDFGVLAVEVCEDIWSPDGPMRRRCFSGAELVVNISSSPYRIGIVSTRREMLATRSADNQATLVYANRVGSQDGLVFDGGGYVFQNGRLVLDAPRFQEGWWSCVVDLDRTARLRRELTTWRSDWERFISEQRPVPVIRSDAPTADRSRLRYPAPPGGNFFLPPATPEVQRSPRDELLDDVFEVLALGVADYFRKTRAFTGIGVALSGGRDSLLGLLVAWHALGRIQRSDGSAAPPKLTAFYMPSRFSQPETRDAARTIARELGVELVEVSIDEALDREMDAARAMLQGGEPTPITQQNIQARLRGTRMWNWANSAGALFIQTGDMSEKAVGYTTIGGDLEGAFSPIANVPKTVVVALLERLYRRFGFQGIRMTLDTPAGPELAAGQTAEAELMPFEVLDACLALFAGEKLSAAEVAEALPALFPDRDPAELREHARRFASMFTRSIYKWVQAPLSVHIGALDLERERALQLPVVQQNEWGGLEAAEEMQAKMPGKRPADAAPGGRSRAADAASQDNARARGRRAGKTGRAAGKRGGE
ncbi:MAG: NAD(+) synthase [bacterium]|nr:MAG: NAD(+) synthase [bacterium]